MYSNDVNYLRNLAENERLERFRANEEQRTYYTRMVDNVARAELNEDKLRGCFYLCNAIKSLLENGDYIVDEHFERILSEADPEFAKQ